MKKPLLLAALSLLLLPPAARAQWTAGLRLGYARAGGNAAGGSPMSDGVKGQLPVQLEGGYRVWRDLTVGAYGSYGPGQVGATCDGASCSASVLRLGVQASWQFGRLLGALPWAGAGFGYEWANYKATDGGDQLQVRLRGLELLSVQGGADYPVAGKLLVGPFLSLAFGRYGSLKVTSPLGNSSGGAPNSGTHTWLSFGVRGSYQF